MKHSSLISSPGPDPVDWTQLACGPALERQLHRLVPELCQRLNISGLFTVGELAAEIELPPGLIRETFRLQAADFLPGWQEREYLPAIEDSLSNLLICQMLDTHQEPELLLAELARVLVPGGHLLLSGCLKYAPVSWAFRALGKARWPKMPLGWLDTRTLLIKQELFPVSVHWLAPVIAKPVVQFSHWAGPMTAVGFVIVARKGVFPATPLRLRMNPVLPVFGQKLQSGSWCEASE